MISFKQIKRKYKLINQNFADWFSYKNTQAYFTSTLREFIEGHCENILAVLHGSGLAAAYEYIEDINYKSRKINQERRKDINSGFELFIDHIRGVKDPRNPLTGKPGAPAAISTAELRKRAQAAGFKSIAAAARVIGKKGLLVK